MRWRPPAWNPDRPPRAAHIQMQVLLFMVARWRRTAGRPKPSVGFSIADYATWYPRRMRHQHYNRPKLRPK